MFNAFGDRLDHHSTYGLQYGSHGNSITEASARTHAQTCFPYLYDLRLTRRLIHPSVLTAARTFRLMAALPKIAGRTL